MRLRILSRLTQSIAGQLIESIFGIYFIVAIAVTLVQIGFEFSNVKENFIEQFSAIEKSFGPALSRAMWEENDVAVKSVLDGLLKDTEILGVKIINERGKLGKHVGQILTKDGTHKQKKSYLKKLFFYEFPIIFKTIKGRKETVGKAFIYSSNLMVLQRIKYSLVLIVINSIIKTAILWFIMIFFIHKILGRPIAKISEKVESLNFDDLTPIEDISPYENELSSLRKSFNTLIDRLTKSKKEILESNKELNNYQNLLEEKVERRTLELERSVKKEKSANMIKDQFLANISHEIRTPLNSIIGFAQILGSRQNLTSEESEHYSKGLAVSSKNLLELLNNILDLSKVEAGKLSLNNNPIKIKDFFFDLEQMFSSQMAEKGIYYSVNVDPTIPESIVLDETRLRQILFNLINNAIKFTKQGFVKINVLSNLNTDDSTSLKYDLKIIVEDSGVGIPKQDQEAIFSPFVQKEGQSINDYGGTGLGLSITKGLIELMNGEISVESDVGKGSKFIVVLSEISTTNEESLELQEDINYQSVVFKPAKVLIVEDLKVNMELLLAYLKPYDLQITTAVNGLEGVNAAKETDFDIVLMDMAMPVMDGFESARIMREELGMRDTPIIAVTASLEDSDLNRAKNIITGIIYKPILIDRLILELCKYLPYEEVEQDKSANSPESYEGYFEKPNGDMDEFYKDLKALIFSWDEVKDTLTINELEEFSTGVVICAEKYKWLDLKKLGDKLKVCVNLFEMDRIPNILREFHDLVKDYEDKAA